MNKWNEQDICFLKDNFNKYTKKELANILQRTESSIQIKANRLGLKRKEKYFYNKEFFKCIDNEEKAYWLGFIYADGYVSKNKKGTKYSLGIELQKSDDTHLKKFNKSLNGNVQVTYRTRNNIEIAGKCVESANTCVIRLYCTSMALDLINHGCCLNKSKIKTEPKGVSNDLIKHFIRGYFDGNGSITHSYNKAVDKYYFKVTISTGSIEFAKWINLYLNNIGIDSSFYKDGKVANKIQLFYKDNKKFLDYIYKDSNIYLDRKYNKYLIAVYGENVTSIHK